MLQVVWFKRDLRWHDHAPLARAARTGPVLALYVDEPDVEGSSDRSQQHRGFVDECLEELDVALRARGNRLVRMAGHMPDVLEHLFALSSGFTLWSHEETGNAVTFARDRRVARWCRDRGIAWNEVPQHGVVRGLRDRDGWAVRWDARMSEPQIAVPDAIARWRTDDTLQRALSTAPSEARATVHPDKAERQRGGRARGVALLESFLADRMTDYRAGMSSPVTGAEACSRLSAHFAYGSVSIREAAQAAWLRRSELLQPGARRDASILLQALKAFESRLHWHCHFMQKLETEPEIEWRNMHRGHDGLRVEGAHPDRLGAWCEGRTGYPMVDACMRMLATTGWLNFRMRAMVTSFASYHLWLHWRDSGLHLAREFLDYEPGIHWSQCQMQSGTTGINTLRIYNPVKQAIDHDPDGHFVRRWVPELSRVSTPGLFEPWKLSPSDQRSAGCVIGRDYPMPIVDPATAVREARERMWSVRKNPAAADEALAVFRRHGSRNPSREAGTVRRRGTARKTSKGTFQQDLDFGEPPLQGG